MNYGNYLNEKMACVQLNIYSYKWLKIGARENYCV